MCDMRQILEDEWNSVCNENQRLKAMLAAAIDKARGA